MTKSVKLIYNLRSLKKEIKILNSLVIILRDALDNETGTFKIHHIIDSLDILIFKTQEIINSYNSLSETIIETETCMQMKNFLYDTRSMFSILKFAIKVKSSDITYDDIFNTVNVISKITEKIFEHAKEINNSIDNINIIYL